jgi:hypothetical protein
MARELYLLDTLSFRDKTHLRQVGEIIGHLFDQTRPPAGGYLASANDPQPGKKVMRIGQLGVIISAQLVDK